MQQITVPIRRVRGSEAPLPLPAYQTDGSAGMDLFADVETPLTLERGERAVVATGISIALPAGYEAQIRPRSGLAARRGVTLLNAPGTIDSDYRGEIQVILVNLGHEPFVIRRGDRIAQMVIAPVARATWVETDCLDPTTRGSGGFGHTGVR